MLVIAGNMSATSRFDSLFGKMQQDIEAMREHMNDMFDGFQDWVSDGMQFKDATKSEKKGNNLKLKYENGKAVITVKLEGVDTFDAKLTPKKDRFDIASLVIKTEEPKKQQIVISIDRNYVDIYQRVEAQLKPEPKQSDKEADKPNARISKFTVSESNVTRSLPQLLNLQDAAIEYDKKVGLLTITIPEVKKEEGKEIEVKIK